MIKGTVSVRFPAGETISAAVEAEDPTDTADVTWSGPIDRLPRVPVRTSWDFLRVYLGRIAREQDGVYGDELSGEAINPDEVLEEG